MVDEITEVNLVVFKEFSNSGFLRVAKRVLVLLGHALPLLGVDLVVASEESRVSFDEVFVDGRHNKYYIL